MPFVHRVLIVLCLLGLGGMAHGAEFAFHPSLAVSEEYTDNVFETKTNRKSEYITRLLPGIQFDMKSPVLNADLNYQFDYRYYARQSRKDDTTHLLLAHGHLTVIDNLLFLDVSDDYQRVSLDVTRDVRQESLFVNQTDRNVVTAFPHVVLHPDARTSLRTGYRYTDTRYFESVGVSKTDHTGLVDLTRELTPRWSLTASYAFTRELAAIDDFSQHHALGGFRYEYADKSFLFAQAGHSWIAYDSGHRLRNLIWNVGASHAFDTLTVKAATGVKYDEDPLRNITQETFVTGDLEKILPKGLAKLSLYYSEYIQAETDILDTRKYGAALRGAWEMTSLLHSTAGFMAERYDQRLQDSYTRRFVFDAGLGYELADKLILTLSYIFVDSYSPRIESETRRVNRAAVELRKTF